MLLSHFRQVTGQHHHRNNNTSQTTFITMVQQWKKIRASKASARQYKKRWRNLLLKSQQYHRLPQPMNGHQKKTPITGYQWTVLPLWTKPCPSHPSVILSTALRHRINAHNILQDNTRQRPQSNNWRATDHPFRAWTETLHTVTRAPKCHHKRSILSQLTRALKSHPNNGNRLWPPRIMKHFRRTPPQGLGHTRELLQNNPHDPRTGHRDHQYSWITSKVIRTPKTRHHVKGPRSHPNGRYENEKGRHKNTLGPHQ